MSKLKFYHGIEQEFQIVNRETGELSIPNKKDRTVARQVILEKIKGSDLCNNKYYGIDKEWYPCQIEIKVGIAQNLTQLFNGLKFMRNKLIDMAEDEDYGIIATGRNIFSERYDKENSEYEEATSQKVENQAKFKRVNFGEHHHISCETLRELVVLTNVYRTFTPELSAFSVNSPQLTKQSALSERMRYSPHIGPLKMPVTENDLINFKKYILYISQDTGRKYRFLDVSPFSFITKGLQTVEVRLFDVQYSYENSLFLSALLEGLKLKVLEMDKKKESLPPDIYETTLTANRKNAYDAGLSAKFKIDEKMRKFYEEHGISDFSSDEILARDSLLGLTEFLEKELHNICDGTPLDFKKIKKRISEPLNTCAEEQKKFWDKKKGDKEAYLKKILEVTKKGSYIT